MKMKIFTFLFVYIFVLKTTFAKDVNHAKIILNGKSSNDKVQIITEIQGDNLIPNKKDGSALSEVSNKTNGPYFIYPPYAELFKKQTYFGRFSNCSNDTTIVQLKATDFNHDKASMIEYNFVNTTWKKYFSLNPLSGLIKTLRPLSEIKTQWPITFYVQARDGPTNDSDSLATTQVVINGISENDEILLLLCGLNPKDVTALSSTIVPILEQTTDLIVGLENITEPPNNSPENATSAILLYFIDPSSETVLSKNYSKVRKNVLSDDALKILTKKLNSKIPSIYRVLVSDEPLTCSPKPDDTIILAMTWSEWAILAVALIIGLLGIGCITYICILWSRHKDLKDRTLQAYITPVFDPILFNEPIRKRYETQELEMNVPQDDSDSANDLQLDLSNRNHNFDIDNVNYIQKVRRHGVSSSSSDEATNRAMNVRRHNNNHIRGNNNQAYLRSNEDLAVGSKSPSNRNVTFRERKDLPPKGFNYLKSHPANSSTIF